VKHCKLSFRHKSGHYLLSSTNAVPEAGPHNLAAPHTPVHEDRDRYEWSLSAQMCQSISIHQQKGIGSAPGPRTGADRSLQMQQLSKHSGRRSPDHPRQCSAGSWPICWQGWGVSESRTPNRYRGLRCPQSEAQKPQYEPLPGHVSHLEVFEDESVEWRVAQFVRVTGPR
jgi:hypothetical protein